jgi:hypothetical protein
LNSVERTNKHFESTTNFISLPRVDIVGLKKAWRLIISVLNDPRCTWSYEKLDNARILIENVGARCKECNHVEGCSQDD